MSEWRKSKRSHEGGIKVVKGNLYARIQWVDEVSGKRKEKHEGWLIGLKPEK